MAGKDAPSLKSLCIEGASDHVVALAENVMQMVPQVRVDLHQQDAQSLGNSSRAEPVARLWLVPFHAVALEPGGALNG